MIIKFFMNSIKYFFVAAASIFVPLSVFAGTLSLTPQTGTYKIGDTFSVAVYLNTEGSDIAAVDLELAYPNNLLEVVDADSAKAGTQITPGTLMPQNMLNIIENGKVRFGQITYAQRRFTNNTRQLFATMQFRALASGVAPVTILHTPGETRDSNIARVGVDILNRVDNASFTILPADGKMPSQGSSYTFTRNLVMGSTGADVKELQKFLNAQGFLVAVVGLGSPGNETTYFGGLTKTALIRFQDAHKQEILAPVGLTKGTGFFGSSTRNKVHGLLRLTLPPQASPQAQTQIQSLQEQLRQAQEQVNKLLQQLQAAQ